VNIECCVNLFRRRCVSDLQWEKTQDIENRSWIGMARLEDCDAGWRVTFNMSFPPARNNQQPDPEAMEYPIQTGMPSDGDLHLWLWCFTSELARHRDVAKQLPTKAQDDS